MDIFFVLCCRTDSIFIKIHAGSQQGRSQKFVLGGIKFFWGIKLLNSRSDVIFTP